MTVTTSKPSPVVIGQGSDKETIYTATKTRKMADGTYSVEMIQYSNALGQDGRVIAERDGVNNWNFKDGVDNKLKQNENKLNKASRNQMESMRGNFVQNAQEAKEYNESQGQPNVATTDENEGGSQPSGEQSKPAPGVNKGIKGTGGIYPEDIGNTKQDVIKFDMLEYRPSKFEDRPSVDTAKIIETVILAVPGGIQDQNIANWNSETINPLQKAAAGIASGAIDGKAQGESISSQLVGRKDDIKTAISGYFTGQATGIGQQALQRGAGVVLNPNMELLFNGPSVRQFSFNFLLAPRSESEQKQVVNIIRFFKQGMSPIKSQSNLFLKSPNTFRLRYIHRQSGDDSEHKFLSKFKECALTNTGVNYTPNNNYATFPDGGMVAYQLTLSFQELEPVFNNDYAEVKEGIGY